MVFTNKQMRIIRYCAEEVERQRDCPTAVYWMLEAWLYASNHRDGMSLKFIEEVAMRVEIHENKAGFRTVPVFVGGHQGCPVAEIRERLQRIIDADLTPEEFYYEFQLIHPLRDGNGRTGKILMNFLAGTLDAPTMPPNFFGCSNP